MLVSRSILVSKSEKILQFNFILSIFLIIAFCCAWFLNVIKGEFSDQRNLTGMTAGFSSYLKFISSSPILYVFVTDNSDCVKSRPFDRLFVWLPFIIGTSHKSQAKTTILALIKHFSERHVTKNIERPQILSISV